MVSETVGEATLATDSTVAEVRLAERLPGAIVDWLQQDWLQLALCLLTALPLLYPHLPPLTDLGGHLGRFAVQIDGGASASLRQWYDFHWALIPNLGTDVLMQLLAPALGLEPALRTIVIAIVVVQTAGVLVLARVVHGTLPPTALLALPLAYGYPFQYGFLNFALCMALGTCALAAWIALGRSGRWRARWLGFAVGSCLLWACHLEGWALFCVLAGADELARWRLKGLAWQDACLRASLSLSCLLGPVILQLALPTAASEQGRTEGFFDVVAKLGMIIMVVRDRWGVWDVLSALLLVAAIGWTWRSRWFETDKGLALGAVLLWVAFALAPKHINGTSFVDMRMVPMTFTVALVAVRPRRHCPPRVREALALAALAFYGARMAGTGAAMVLWDRQFTQDLAVLDSVPVNAGLVSLTLKPCLHWDPWQHERRTHFAGYALARRHAFANDQWDAPGAQLLRVHNPAAGQFARDPSQTASPTPCRGRPAAPWLVGQVPRAIRYLWIIEDGLPRPYAGWRPIRQSAGSVLYRRE